MSLLIKSDSESDVDQRPLITQRLPNFVQCEYIDYDSRSDSKKSKRKIINQRMTLVSKSQASKFSSYDDETSEYSYRST